MPEGTTWTTPGGGLFVWATLPDGLDSKAMMPRAIAARVAYVPGTGFYADGTGTGNMRLNFSFPPPERIREGVRRLAGVMEQDIAMRRVFGAGRRRRRPTAAGPAPTCPVPTWHDSGMASPPPSASRDRFRRRADLHVLVLAGGLSYERDVSLRSGRRVLDALRAVGVEAELRDADVALLPALAADPPDAVVIALHGATGEDGSLRGVLDLCDVPYVGCDARASRLAWDKPSAKAVLREAGIPTPDWVALPHDRFSELGAVAVLDRIVDRLGPAADGQAGAGRFRTGRRGGPGRRVAAGRDGGLLRVRPDGAGRAVRARHGRGGLRARPRRRARRRCRRWRSCRATASTTTPPATPPAVTTWHAPARLDPEVAAAVAEVALAAHTALGLRDLSRVDLIVDAGRPAARAGGQRLAGHDGDVAAAARRAGGRAGLRPTPRHPGRPRRRPPHQA